jgi:ribosomal protein L16/L10AE
MPDERQDLSAEYGLALRRAEDITAAQMEAAVRILQRRFGSTANLKPEVLAATTQAIATNFLAVMSSTAH